jgi:hypothetical protein
MSERRASRLVLEVAFLVALSAALTFADLETYEIVGVMLLGWLLVAVFEWGALRGRAHYGSGLPPRWYVPRITLPPPRPLEQFSAGYPAAEAATDAPTWIASPSMLADWPVADVEPGVESPPDEQTHVHDGFDTERSVVVTEDDDVLEEAEPEELEDEPEPARPAPAPRPAPRPREGARTARHVVDPLAAPAAKGRRFGKRSVQTVDDAEVPEGPPPHRVLPSQSRGEE